MGLLQRAIEQKEYLIPKPIIGFVEIKEKLSEYKDSIVFHSQLFNYLTDFFTIEKGALLIKDGDYFQLSSVIGYDETTIKRLQLSKEEFTKWNDTKEISILEKYFSIGEFMGINDVVLIPFTNNGEIEGLLLITKFTVEKHRTYNEMAHFIQELEGLWKFTPLNRLKNKENQGDDLTKSVSSYALSVKNKSDRVIFLKLELLEIFKELIQTNPMLTTTSIKNNALKILTSFVGNNGKIFQLPDHEILLLLLDKQGHLDIEIVKEQINIAFKSIFSKDLVSLDFNYDSFIWKNNSLEMILSKFISK